MPPKRDSQESRRINVFLKSISYANLMRPKSETQTPLVSACPAYSIGPQNNCRRGIKAYAQARRASNAFGFLRSTQESGNSIALVSTRASRRPLDSQRRFSHQHQRRARCVRWCSLSHSLRAVFIRVCQPGPSARNAARISGSIRIATCSLVGFLFFPRVFRSALIVAATPPPCVTTPCFQSMPSGGASGIAAAFAAATCFELKIFKIALDL